MPRDTVNVTAPVQDIARAYAIAAERDVSLSQLTIQAWEALEAGGDSVNPASHQRTSSPSFDGIRLADIDLSGYLPGEPEHTASKVLWGQFSRFLTVKYTLRILASLGTGPVPLIAWQDAVTAHSFLMREHLREKDVRHKIPRGTQLSAGFPRGKSRKRDQSMSRFLGHYTAYVQGSGAGPVVGMSAELGMIHVDLPSKEVRLTQAGVDYVSLENPQLDGDDDSTDATTPEERAFILTHIKANLKEDWAFCTDVLKSISDGWNGSETLEAAMTEKHPNLGANTLRTNTGGALGRLGDLRLIERSWTRRKVTYLLTQAGLDEVT